MRYEVEFATTTERRTEYRWAIKRSLWTKSPTNTIGITPRKPCPPNRRPCRFRPGAWVAGPLC